MLCDSTLDALEMRNRTRQVLTEFCFPSLFIVGNPLPVARSEYVGIDSSVLGLGFEESGCFESFHSRLFEQHVQVEQITALETLQDTSQLLCCDLEGRVYMNSRLLGQVRPTRQQGSVLGVDDILIIGDVEFERPIST